MTTVAPSTAPILSALDSETARRHWAEGAWPKWSTQCFMRSVGLPVLAATLVTPAQPDLAEPAARHLAEVIGTDRVMVRSDGGAETSRYRRGGHTLAVPDAVAWSHEVLAEGRAVLFLEPTNRFRNELTAMIRIDRQAPPAGLGKVTVELLGPGFDLADLARSGIRPQARIEVRNLRWGRREPVWPQDFAFESDQGSHAERIDARLEFIGGYGLPGLRPDSREGRIRAARRWLRDEGIDHLSRDCDYAAALALVPGWLDAADRVTAGLQAQPWDCLATGWSDLGNGRSVYWDVIEGGRKYGHQH